jgi:hypothetical protein
MAQTICPGCRLLVNGEIAALDDHCEFNYWINPINPIRDYKLSENDRIWLRVQRILPDV